mmetsp:Transcript_10289/g.18775  ORF Transcript_10289/g.18775 Transcript_10289/m.18775 type:complete len:424 (-) Transcript_10289:3799-5070(-)
MRYSVREHNLGPSKLVLRSVNLPSQQLVERGESGKNHRAVLHLNGTLAETVQVGADSDRAAGNIRKRENLVVRTRGLSSNHSGASEVLDTDSMHLLVTHDSLEDMARLAIDVNFVGDDCAFWNFLVICLVKVEVFKALVGVVGVGPCDFELGFEVLVEADAGSRVGGDEDARQAFLSRQLRSLEEEVVFRDSERAGLERDVVGDHHDFATFGILGSLHLALPADHTHIVGSSDLEALVEFAGGRIHDELGRFEDVLGHFSGRAAQVGFPALEQSHFDQGEEVVRIRRSDAPDIRPLHLKLVGCRVRFEGAQLSGDLGIEQAELGRNAIDRTDFLLVGLDVEQLASKRRSNETQRKRVAAFILLHELDLYLIDPQAHQSLGVLGDELVSDALELARHVLDGCFAVRKHVEEDTRRRSGENLRVQ